jgi:hypothetical protein
MTRKRCTGPCGKVKPLDAFNRDARTADGLRYWCRDCRKEAASRRRAVLRKANAARVWPDDYPLEKRCPACGETKPVATGWGRNSTTADGLQSLCKDDSKLAVKAASRRSRDLCLNAYGRECRCCGSTEYLEMDHVKGDGHLHRAKYGRAPTHFHRYLIANNFPPDEAQTLCHPCNHSKGRGNRCKIHGKYLGPVTASELAA